MSSAEKCHKLLFAVHPFPECIMHALRIKGLGFRRPNTSNYSRPKSRLKNQHQLQCKGQGAHKGQCK